MEFKLILVPKYPNEFLLKDETPLSGLKFVEQAAACLRRNLDTQTRSRHITLGNISQYEISVPQALAIDSGWFTTSNCRYISCAENYLKPFIFYGATMSTAPSNRPVYPYYQNEVVLISYIDELAILDEWKRNGYPVEMGSATDKDPSDTTSVAQQLESAVNELNQSTVSNG